MLAGSGNDNVAVNWLTVYSYAAYACLLAVGVFYSGIAPIGMDDII